ncbi:MAG: papain-like cysteine protease family protein [Gemmatimonadaceae bacterium]
MPNRLLDLFNSLGPAATRQRERPAKKKRKAKAPLQTPPTASAPSAAPAAKPALAKASSAVDYSVPGFVAPIAQPSGMTCWATVATMMTCWRKQQSMTIATVMGQIGATYLTKFSNNQGLTAGEKATFLAAAGLAYEYPQSRTVAGWEALLRAYGPIWVTTDEKPGAGFSIHARLITGIHGDGTPAGTSLDIVDPAGGKAYPENYGAFVKKYEEEALDPKSAPRIQIVHWPHDTLLNVARSVSARVGTYAQSLEVGRFATVDDAEFEPSYREGHRGWGGGGHHGARAHSSFAHGLDAPKVMGAADVHWAADADCVDYRHLATAIDTKPFDLTAAILDRLVRFNRFTLDGVSQKVVFGLRGCTMDADVPTLSKQVTLREVEPNHIDNRCVIGVWDRSTDTLAAFQASTVPNWEYMETYRENHGKKANLLPTGRYKLTVGTHRAKKRNASGELVDNPGRIQGALRNDDEVLVLRTEDDLTYTVRDTWDKTVPNDNIHPGIVTVNTGSSTVPDYSSAGCNTIPGTSSSDTPSGAWADFRRALGLDNTHPTANDGQAHAYVLLTGREARLAAGGNTTLGRLRFGSNGDDVRQLQSGLAKHAKKYYSGKVDGELGPGTAMAFVRFQKDQGGGAADAIVTSADATALGFTLSPAAAASSGAKALDIAGDAWDLAKGIFKKWAARPEEGKFSVESDIAEILHEDTAASQQWRRKSADFMLKATQPSIGKKDVARLNLDGGNTYHFKFRVIFEYNGHDIRAAQITRVVQDSTGLKDEKFAVKFVAKNGSAPKAESSKIDFIFKDAKWDPAIGEKAYDFSGKISVESDGFIDLDLDKNERVSVEFINKTTFGNVQDTKLAIPRVYKFFGVYLFEKEEQSDLSAKWVERLKQRLASLKAENEVRYNRLRNGSIPITVEGYASATGKEKFNRNLAAKRAKTVADLLRMELTSAAKVIEGSHGEPTPTTPANKEVADPLDRRVEIRFEVPE